MFNRITAEVWCKTGTSNHRTSGGSLLGDPVVHSHTSHYRVASIEIEAPHTGWTESESISCPVCGGRIETKVRGCKADALRVMIGAIIFAAAAVGIGLYVIPMIDSRAWRIVSVIGLYGLAPAFALLWIIVFVLKAFEVLTTGGRISITKDGEREVGFGESSDLSNHLLKNQTCRSTWIS